MNIAIVSLATSVVTGACFASSGWTFCVDADRLSRSSPAGRDRSTDSVVARNAAAGRLVFSIAFARRLGSLVVFISVGTPQDVHRPGRPVVRRQVAEQIADALDSYKVVVTKSTVPVEREPASRRSSGASGRSFSVATAEFLREGSAIGTSCGRTGS